MTDHNLTPAVERLATLAGGVADSFDKGSELLEETAAISLSESTMQRTTEATGRRLAAALAQGQTFGEGKSWQWYLDALGRRVAYTSIDATGVRQQGPHGTKAEGRMAYVGMVFNPLPDSERVFEGLPKPGHACRLVMLADYIPWPKWVRCYVGKRRKSVWTKPTSGSV